MNYLYEDFLDDQTVYLQNEAYYQVLFTKVIGEEPVTYYNTTFKSGKRFFNGNPIFSTKYNNRLIRIIQDEPESEKPYFYARIETKEDALNELVINLELTKEIEPKLVDYIEKWFKEKVSIAKMKQLIKSYSYDTDLVVEEVKEPEISYKKSKIQQTGNKFTETLVLYTKELKHKTGILADADLLKAVTKACGPSIYNKDSSRVAILDPKELLRIKKNFLIKKLGLKDSPSLDIAIKEVGAQLGKSNKNKFRAIFYYLLVKKFNKESIFLK